MDTWVALTFLLFVNNAAMNMMCKYLESPLSTLFIAKYYSIVEINYVLFIYTSVDGHKLSLLFGSYE